jgi:hypothetical protein
MYHTIQEIKVACIIVLSLLITISLIISIIFATQFTYHFVQIEIQKMYMKENLQAWSADKNGNVKNSYNLDLKPDSTTPKPQSRS